MSISEELVAECIHCGFCLPTCPTWLLWGEEMDSPRGRLHLMEGLVRGELELGATVATHFDRCLGCMACVTACPSGVRYDVLIEETRAEVEALRLRSRAERLQRALLFAVVPYRRRLRLALRLAPLARALPSPRVARPLLDLAPSRGSRERPPELTPAAGEALGRAALLAGCVQSVVFGDVNAATARALAADGWEVVVPPRAGCCGALDVHAGRLEQGRRRARLTIAALEEAGADVLVTNAAGCGSNLKEYGRLLADDPDWAERARAFSERVRDVTELLGDPLAPHAERRPLPLRVALQDSCHLQHAQGVREEPRAMLAAVPGLALAEPAEQAICCGSAGIYNIVQADAARTLGDRKAGNVLATAADVYASANPGCLLQLSAALRRAGEPLPALHPVELVDASIRGVRPEQLLESARR